MNKQRKVVITTTYNEMGIIIDTKAEEVAQPDLQPTCNGLATDCISRQAAIDALMEIIDRPNHAEFLYTDEICKTLNKLPSAQPEIIRCLECKHLQKWRSEESAKKFGQIYECARNVFNCPKPEDFCSRAERLEDE